MKSELWRRGPPPPGPLRHRSPGQPCRQRPEAVKAGGSEPTHISRPCPPPTLCTNPVVSKVVWEHEYHLGICKKCKLLGSAPDLLHQEPPFCVSAESGWL